MNNLLVFILALAACLGMTAFIMVIVRSDKSCLNESNYNGVRPESYKKNTTDRMKLNVIIPIRDRDKHLAIITDVLEKIFQYQNIEAQYTIIEQAWGKPFNKAVISNAGFLEADASNFSSIYLFQDVDLYPVSADVIDYRENTTNIIRHQYGNKHTLGGFFKTTGSVFKYLNGYSNNFWNWGGEDVNLLDRARIKKIKIDRTNFLKRGKTTLIHDDVSFTSKTLPSTKPNQDLKKKLKKLYKTQPELIMKDGLSNVIYTIISKTKYKNKSNMNRILISI